MFDFDKNTKDKIILWLMFLLTAIFAMAAIYNFCIIFYLKTQPNYSVFLALISGIFGIISFVCGIKQYVNNRKFGVDKIKQCVNDVANDEESC